MRVVISIEARSRTKEGQSLKGKCSRREEGFSSVTGSKKKKGKEKGLRVGVTEKETNAEGDFLETLPLRADLDFHTSPSTILL